MTLIDRREVLCRISAVPLGAAALATVPGLAGAHSSSGVLIHTANGQVRGRMSDGVRLFTGIPYGKAPRFGIPVQAERWDGVLDATRPPNVAPQPPGMMAFSGSPSEDCLQLNVWSPDEPGPHPVLVYIHGGGNETGWSGDASTAGDRFAAHGLVCVTANYRVGALGFLELGDLLGPAYASSGNNGMRDLILALKWVRANIAAFGGDPRRVTIAGESAGGKNVGTLMGLPAADGLYHQVALFSGGAQTVHAPETARRFASLLADKMGDTQSLKTASIDRLLTAQTEAKAQWNRNFPFRPVVDGQFLSRVPLERIRRGECPRVPMVIGTNADESRLFLPPDVASGPLRPSDVANETIVRMGKLDRQYANAFPELSDAERRWRLMTAEEYGMPCLRIAEAHAARGARVHRYRFAYPAPGGPFKGHTPHVMDVPFTFDHLQQPAFAGFFGFSTADQPMAEMMHGAMVSFVKNGYPAADGLPDWPPYDGIARSTMVLDRNPALIRDPDGKERTMWQVGTSDDRS